VTVETWEQRVVVKNESASGRLKTEAPASRDWGRVIKRECKRIGMFGDVSPSPLRGRRTGLSKLFTKKKEKGDEVLGKRV